MDCTYIVKELNVDMRLQIYWADSRLDDWKSLVAPGKKYKGINLKYLNRIWYPDIFIGKEVRN
jgi:hypothetical protein